MISAKCKKSSKKLPRAIKIRIIIVISKRVFSGIPYVVLVYYIAQEEIINTFFDIFDKTTGCELVK